MRPAPPWLLPVFFASGFAALIYQVTWQRMLFAIVGIDTVSVTLIVTAFLLGLGLGNGAGGALARSLPAMRVFAALELGIGVYGFLSIRLFEAAGEASLHWGHAGTFALVFALVLAPTLMMGATLPLLTAHLARATGNVGRSLGLLAFVNTLGAALAAFATAHVLLALLGRSGTVLVAALLNVLVGLTVLLLAPRRPEVAPAAEDFADPHAGSFPWRAAALAFLSGFVSLGFEILWARSHGFATAGVAHGFGELLGAYLVGIALGSVLARRFCAAAAGRSQGRASGLALGASFVISGFLGLLSLPLASRLCAGPGASTGLWVYGLAATSLGAGFPLVAHLGAAVDGRLGPRLGALGLVNVIGCAAGSLTVGFLMLEHLSLPRAASLVSALALATGAWVLAATARPRTAIAALGLAGLAIVTGPLLHDALYERLQPGHGAGEPFAQVVETRSGVVTVTRDGRVFGGGAYDGGMNLDPVADTNGILRAYALAVLHPEPRDVLMIGLGSGAWALATATHPGLRKLTVVEINPGYLEVVRAHRLVGSLLSHPKVEIVIDDGRRWLRRTERRFDVIVQNTTHHWRAHATNLVSREHLALVRSRLQSGGVFYQNATGSGDVLRTMFAVFPEVRRFRSFVAGSGRSLAAAPGAESILRRWTLPDGPAFRPGDAAAEARISEILGAGDWEGGPDLRTRLEDRRVITDENMATEWWLTRR
jgi:spermidine synthase